MSKPQVLAAITSQVIAVVRPAEAARIGTWLALRHGAWPAGVRWPARGLILAPQNDSPAALHHVRAYLDDVTKLLEN